MDVTVIWAAIIALGIFMYVVLDGFDLGIGIVFPFFPDEKERDLMMNTVAPVWDGNDTWKAYEKGATLVQLYTALTFQGFGIVKEMHDTIKKKLGGSSLQDYIEKRNKLS